MRCACCDTPLTAAPRIYTLRGVVCASCFQAKIIARLPPARPLPPATYRAPTPTPQPTNAPTR